MDDLDTLEVLARAANQEMWKAYLKEPSNTHRSAVGIPRTNRDGSGYSELLCEMIEDYYKGRNKQATNADAAYIAAVRPAVVLALIERLRKAEARE